MTSPSFIASIQQPSRSGFAQWSESNSARMFWDVYDTTNDAKSALEAGQIDGIVVDLPTAFYIVAVEIPKGKVVGQFPATGDPEQFGLLFEKDSPLVACVNSAIASLKSDGTLAQIQQEWLADKTSAPVFS